MCIREATARANDTTSTGSADRMWTKAAVRDALGNGQSVRITTPSKNGLELIQVFTLYSNRSAVVLQCGVRNRSAKPVSIKELIVLENAQLWPDVTEPQEPKTLDGLSGLDNFQNTKTRVENGSKRCSYNNLLYTFKHKGKRRSLVLGGLTYYDFAKYAAVDNGTLSLYGKDVVGRQVDAGDVYVPEDRFYVDGSQPDPFEALESYGRHVATAHSVKLQTYSFPTVCA